MASRKISSPRKPAGEAKAPTPRKATAAKAAPARKKAAASGTEAKRAAPARKTATAAKTKAAAPRPKTKAAAPRSKKVQVVEEVPETLEAPAAALAAARIAADAALDKKAEDVVILDVAGLTGYADCFVIATGTSDRQVSAIADSIEEKMKKAGHRPIGVEGHGLGHWVLLDFGDVVAHVFYEEARALYDVEGLWADARRVPVE
ncbi:MAG TPA: ribosome silencing factor [Vulgatibacter sp.]